jgi:hypothetical protein
MRIIISEERWNENLIFITFGKFLFVFKISETDLKGSFKSSKSTEGQSYELWCKYRGGTGIGYLPTMR